MKTSLGKAWEVANAAAIINAYFLLGMLIFVLVGISPPVRSICERIARPTNHSPVVDLPRETKLAKVRDAIKIATSDGEFWDSIFTIEDKYKGLYSEKNPPPYWRFIEDDFALGKKLGLVKLEKLPDYGSLTRNERLSLSHPNDINWRTDIVESMLNSFSLKAHFGFAFPKEIDLNWAVIHLPKDFVFDSGKLSKAWATKWLQSEESDLQVNPFSNDMTKYNCKTFSPGDGYAEYHYGDDEWARLMKTYVVLAEDYSPMQAQRHGFMYYRIYGEKGIIVEGVRSDPYGSSRISAEGKIAPLVIKPHE
jgi:hypothetical protein